MSTVMELPKYVMPKAVVGMMANWFMDGSTDAPRAAIVRTIGDRTVTLVTFDGSVTEHTAVRHASDPDLVQNPNLRRFGCWDYVPAVEVSTLEPQERREIAKLKQTIERLTKRIEILENSKA